MKSNLIFALILGAVAIGVPQVLPEGLLTRTSFGYSRENSRKCTCIANMMQIRSAKEQWGIDHHEPEGTQMKWSDIIGPYIKIKAVCPERGVYELGKLGRNPRCIRPIFETPHVLP